MHAPLARQMFGYAAWKHPDVLLFSVCRTLKKIYSKYFRLEKPERQGERESYGGERGGGREEEVKTLDRNVIGCQ